MRARNNLLSLILTLAVIPIAVTGPAAASASSVAVITAYNGDVTIVKTNGEIFKGDFFGFSLEAGDEIRTGKDSSVEILIRPSNYVHIGANSNMKVQGPKTEDQGSTMTAVDDGVELVQNYLKLKSSEGTSSLAPLRSGGKTKELRAISPRKTKIRDNRPRFVWETSDPTAELQLTVYNEEGVHWKQKVKDATELVYPEDAAKLVAGTTYWWTLETTDPLRFPPLRSKAAFFELISLAEVAKLAAGLTSIDENDKSSPAGQHLMRASLFFDHNLLDDAIRETLQALETDPENTTLRSILARLYSEVGRDKEAMATYDQILEKR